MYSDKLNRFFLSEFKKQTLVTKSKTRFLLYYILILIPLLFIFSFVSYYKRETLLFAQNLVCISLFIVALIHLKHGKLTAVVNVCLVAIGFILQIVLVLRNIVDQQSITIHNFGFDLVFLLSIIIVIVASLVSTKFYQILLINCYTLVLIIVNLNLYDAKDVSYQIAIIAITFFCSIFSVVIFLVVRRLDLVLRQRKSLNQLLKFKIIHEEKLKYDAEAASKAKSEFLTNISHEFLTPMNAVIGLTDVLIAEVKDETQKAYLKQINVESGKLLNLIDEIIDFSKIDKGDFSIKMKEFSIKEELNLVSDKFSKQAKIKDLDIVIQITDNVPEKIFADQKRVNQVITYLVDNAIKFTEKGNISIVCSLKSLDYNGYIEIAVSDTGIGISKQKQNKLFNTFTQIDGSLTRRHGGLGLGLVKAHTLANLMGGNLIVQSDENKGSVFTLTIPLKSREIFNSEFSM